MNSLDERRLIDKVNEIYDMLKAQQQPAVDWKVICSRCPLKQDKDAYKAAKE